MTIDPDLGFRLLERTDFPELQRWLAEPHVSQWWGEPPDAAGIEEKYGPNIDLTDPTLVFVITLDRRPIGMIQTYRLSDNPGYETAVGIENAAGVDLFIGDPGLVGVGLGTEILRLFVARIGWPTYPEVRRYMAGPSVENARSRRAFEKAGFSFVRIADVPDEPEPEYVMVLERPSVPEAPTKLV